MRIDAAPPQKLSPLMSIRISMDILGSYESLIQLLHRFDSDHYLIRVEDLAISPPTDNRSTSSMTVALRIMKEKS